MFNYFILNATFNEYFQTFPAGKMVHLAYLFHSMCYIQSVLVSRCFFSPLYYLPMFLLFSLKCQYLHSYTWLVDFNTLCDAFQQNTIQHPRRRTSWLKLHLHTCRCSFYFVLYVFLVIYKFLQQIDSMYRLYVYFLLTHFVRLLVK